MPEHDSDHLKAARDLCRVCVGWVTHRYPRGDAGAKSSYRRLREQLLDEAEIARHLPKCVRENQTLSQLFEEYTKRKDSELQGKSRGKHLEAEFKPLLTFLESRRHQSEYLIDGPASKITSAIVGRAVRDANALIKSGDLPSAIDRVHTALHGYFKDVCARSAIAVPNDASIMKLFKEIRTRHPAFQAAVDRHAHVVRITDGMSQVLDALNWIRNHASPAHPNAEVLDKEEAALAIAAAKAVLHYVDAKVSSGLSTA